MIYEYEDAEIHKIEVTSFNNEGILERQHLQAALKNKIEIVAPDCLVISEEFSEWEDSKRRIDLLAIDKNANLVVIELKRDGTGEHMELQAIRYSAMVSTLTYKKVTDIYLNYLKRENIEEDAENRLLNFLEWEEPNEEEFVLDVRIVLVSSDFSNELTTAVLWLNERDLDIRCVRLIPYKFQDRILINAQQTIPLPEAEEYQVKLKQKTEEKRQAIKSSKDFTKYKFKEVTYNKRNLVLAVVKSWIEENNPKTIDELSSTFIHEIQGGSMFVEVDKAKEIYVRQGVYR